MTVASQAGVGTAHLSSELDDGGPFTIHGVAIGAGDVTMGSSGVKKKWPADELRHAAETLAGQPLVVDHQNDSEGTIGTVTKSTFEPGVGVLYEAEIAPHYEQYAQDIASGILDVSARAYHDPVEDLEEDDDTDALLTSNVVFDNLSVVSDGAAPSNTANIGEATALAAGPDGDAVAVLSRGGNDVAAAELQQIFTADEEEELQEDEDDDADNESELDEVYSEWKDHVNMSASELEGWMEHPCSDEASQNPEDVQERNLHLLQTDKSEWGDDEIDDAEQTISFISRMSDEENKPADAMSGGPDGCPSEWAISLLNWAYNPFDEIPDVPDEMQEENKHTPDHAMDVDTGTPEWEEGDMVRWQVEPDLFGTIVHVDDEKDIVMVEIMGMESGEMVSTGFTITAGYSDLKKMKVPESKSDMSMHGDKEDEEDMSSSIDADTVEELAMVNGLDINGMVMWDDKMGVVSDFMREDGTLMVEIDVLEREDGSFQKTGDTVTAPLEDSESMSTSADGAVAELASMSTHTPEYSSSVDQEWNKPNMEDFTDAESWDDLDEDEQSSIADHFIASKSGFPPESFGDLALPVVEPDGALNLNALSNAKARAGQVEGISSETESEVGSMIDRLANENFEDASFGDEEENSSTQEGDDRSVHVATLQSDDVRNDDTGQSSWTVAALTASDFNTKTMTTIDYEEASEDAIEEMNDPVVLEQDDVEDLQSKAERAEELDDRLDDVNSTLDELAEDRAVLDEVDEEQVEQLSEYDDARVLTEDEYEELQTLVDDVGSIFAEELANHSPFEAEELSDRFTPTELRERVEEHDEASIGAELNSAEEPEPEGGSASEAELEEGDEEAEEAATAEELRETVASNLEQGGLYKQAEEVRSGEISLEEMGIDPSEVDA